MAVGVRAGRGAVYCWGKKMPTANDARINGRPVVADFKTLCHNVLGGGLRFRGLSAAVHG